MSDLSTPFIPDDAPYSPDQRAWLTGFLAGVRTRLLDTAKGTGSAGPLPPLHILYGSQTGNAEALAHDFAARAKGRFEPIVLGLDEVELDAFAAFETVIIATSTYGEGEMPDNAELFWKALTASTAPRLEHMRFAVIGLGDTAYDDFCQAGKLFDTRLEQLGAQRFVDRLDCDIDFEDAATGWITEGLATIAPEGAAAAAAPAAPAPAKSAWTRKKPYLATVSANRMLSAEGSAKEIRHVEIELGNSGISYEAGDALAVVPQNDPALVEAILQRLGASADAAVAGHDKPLGDLLLTDFEIASPSRDLVADIAERSGDDELSHVQRHGDKEAMAAWLWGRDVLDLLNLNPALPMDAETFLGLSRPLAHRSYSISSSPGAHPGQVHLTVAAVRHFGGGREHKGVASTFLSDRVPEGGTSPIFITPNKAFRVPTDGNAPMIMVGPGTGIAPFRAFLEERRLRGHTGRNWLFFGDQHRATDFIYEDELMAMSADGTLNRLDLAFSRDQAEKIYVQTRMCENGAELFAWLEEGGHFYVCGDATRMARDVDEALADIVASAGNMSAEAADDYLNRLRKEKRYVRDVY